MKKYKHTPGEWIAVAGMVEHPDGDVADICVCYPSVFDSAIDRPREEIYANARLISAAPDLLAALKASHAALIHHPNGDCRSDEDIQLAESALNKALGERT